VAADGAKEAGWALLRNKFYLINFIHDEYLTLLRNDDTLESRIKLKEKLMIDAMRKHMPDMKIKAVSAIMSFWDKAAPDGADILRDSNGRMMPYMPDSVKTILKIQ